MSLDSKLICKDLFWTCLIIYYQTALQHPAEYHSAILVVNVVGGMLEPAKKHLSDLCMVTAPSTTPHQIKLTKKQKKRQKKKAELILVRGREQRRVRAEYLKVWYQISCAR